MATAIKFCQVSYQDHHYDYLDKLEFSCNRDGILQVNDPLGLETQLFLWMRRLACMYIIRQVLS